MTGEVKLAEDGDEEEEDTQRRTLRMRRTKMRHTVGDGGRGE